MSDTETKVYVVDDDQDIRSSLTRALRKRGMDVEAYDSAQAFLREYDGFSAGCVILDYGMPHMSGLELQEHLNQRDYPLAVIFITGHGGVPESVQAMKGGAVDFLEKPFRQSVLVDLIETALKVATDKNKRQRQHSVIRSRFDKLTDRESEIVAHVIAHPAEISSKEIGNHLGISPRTVDHHRARILEKLEVKTLVELLDLATILRQGDQVGSD